MTAPSVSLPAEAGFKEAGLKFLQGLKKNNRRDWFEAHKAEFERELKAAHAGIDCESRESRLCRSSRRQHVRPPQKCMMRIYRDTRFSSDKRPYKSNIAAWWSRAGPRKDFGGRLLPAHFSLTKCCIAAGVYMPERDQLLRYTRVPI